MVFDLGGVVLEFDHMIVCKKLSNFSKFSSQKIYDIIFKSSLNKNFDCGRISPKEFYKKILEKLEINITFDLFKKIWCDIFLENRKMTDFIYELKNNGYKLFLLSNTNELHFDYVEKNFSIIKEFDDFFLSYVLGYRKPDKEIFLELLKKTALPPSNFIYIDDNKEFVDTARSLEIAGIVFKSFEELKFELKKNEIIL